MADTWTLEEAKKDFTAIAEAAYSGSPQFVTNPVRKDLVLLTSEQFDAMRKLAEIRNAEFSDFLVSGPKGDIFPDGYIPANVIPREIDF